MLNLFEMLILHLPICRASQSKRVQPYVSNYTLGCVLCTYFLRKCPNPRVSGHHHFPSTLVVVTCSLDATLVIPCSSLPQWPATAQQLNVPLYQNPRNAPHKIRKLQTENKETTQIILFPERIQFVHLFQKYITQQFNHPLFTLIYTICNTLSHSNNWFQILKSAGDTAVLVNSPCSDHGWDSPSLWRDVRQQNVWHLSPTCTLCIHLDPGHPE